MIRTRLASYLACAALALALSPHVASAKPLPFHAVGAQAQRAAAAAAVATRATRGDDNDKHTPKAQLKMRPSIRMAITVDDLPGGGPEPGGMTHVRMVHDIVNALKAHGVKHATGFVVGSALEGHPERQAAIDDWINAGFDVGNHTFTHGSLSEVGITTYLKDIAANEPLMAQLEQRTGQHEHYFRSPYLDEGNTEAERRGLTRYLNAHNYRMARVSLDFSDWAWSDPYDRCITHDDKEAESLLSQSYLENASAYLVWSQAAAHEVVARSVPQVLLLHASVATAKNLDALLTEYQQAGVRFVSLAEALKDDVYNDSYDTSGASVFVQASHKLARPHPPRLVRPLSLLDLACHSSSAVTREPSTVSP